MSNDRNELAVSLLHEAVYTSRARQAVGAVLTSSPGRCGLGEGPAIELDLSARGQRLYDAIWPGESPPTRVELVRSTLDEWVEIQDAFDRKRNHFLRDFRKANGFDRRDYTPEQEAAFEAGLSRINDEVNERLREMATRLIDA